MKHIKTFETFLYESTVNEGAVKAFEESMKALIDSIETGYGWIDPYYLEDTYFAMQKENGDFFGMPYNAVKEEIYKRLMKADLLYFAADDSGEKKGKKVTSLHQI